MHACVCTYNTYVRTCVYVLERPNSYSPHSHTCTYIYCMPLCTVCRICVFTQIHVHVYMLFVLFSMCVCSFVASISFVLLHLHSSQRQEWTQTRESRSEVRLCHLSHLKLNGSLCNHTSLHQHLPFTFH